MTKADRIKAYNDLYPAYAITGIRKMTESEIESRIIYGAKSLDEMYKTCSNAKRESYTEILETYRPTILGISGNCMTYSVLLVAENGDKLLITKGNNYLIEEVKN